MKRWLLVVIGLLVAVQAAAGPRVIRIVLRDTTKSVAAAALDTIPVASPVTANAPNVDWLYVQGAAAVTIWVMGSNACTFCADSTETIDYSMDGASWTAWSSSQVDGIDVFTGITAATNLKRSSVGAGKPIHIVPSANASATTALPYLTVKYVRLRKRAVNRASEANLVRYVAYIFDEGMYGMAGRWSGFSQSP